VSNAEHPVSQFLVDWVARGARPSEADYDELVARCVDGHTENVTAAQFRREIVSASRDILAAHKVGNSGRARDIARQTTAVLAEALGELPHIDRNAGKTIAEIVDGIPR
jgi:hypothetical protein